MRAVLRGRYTLDGGCSVSAPSVAWGTVYHCCDLCETADVKPVPPRLPPPGSFAALSLLRTMPEPPHLLLSVCVFLCAWLGFCGSLHRPAVPHVPVRAELHGAQAQERQLHVLHLRCGCCSAVQSLGACACCSPFPTSMLAHYGFPATLRRLMHTLMC